MKEFIAREKFLKECMKTFGNMGVTVKAIEGIANECAADVVAVRHGEWYRHDKKKHGDTCYYCSVCEKMALADCMIWELSDYCPHCGAKMDGKRKEQE